MSTFVAVGNCYQPFSRLLDEVARLARLSSLPSPVFVQNGHTPFESAACSATPFLEAAEFARRIEEAQLVILQAGAGSVLHAIRAGKVPVIMPRRAGKREHVDDHQLELARLLGEHGRAMVAYEASELSAAIDAALELQARGRNHSAIAVPALVDMVRRTLDSWDRHSNWKNNQRNS